MNAVISQSMLFPWVGMLEQVRLSDVFVHYNDVQFSKGSLVNRVQVKTESGNCWMTVPLVGHHLGQRIDEISISDDQCWKKTHINMLMSSFCDAPFRDEAIDLVREVYASEYSSLGELAKASFMTLVNFFDLNRGRNFIDSKTLAVSGTGSERVLSIVKFLHADCYITGHGAKNYLKHETFELEGIDVRYLKYNCVPYPQLYGEFTPFVSALDLVANCGKDGAKYICSGTLGWREFLNENQ